MDYILLGTGPGLPEADSHLSSLYVNLAGKHLLIDCGEGTSRQLLRHGLSGDTLDAVFISHFHPDHISGIYMLLQMLYLQDRHKPLPLFLPEREDYFLGTLQFMYTFKEKFSFELQVHSCDMVTQHYLQVQACPTDHLLGYRDIVEKKGLANTMRSYAFRMEGPSGALVYTSDILTTDSVSALLANSHTVIVDAQHPEMEQILKLRDMPIGRILLTHGLSDELAQYLAEHADPRFELAREDIRYHI